MTLHRGKFVCGLGEEGAVADTEHNLGRNTEGCGCHGGATVLEYGLAFVQACGAWLVLRIKYQQKKEAKKKNTVRYLFQNKFWIRYLWTATPI